MADLCTLAQVRAFLQKATTDTAEDAVISTMITRASAAIERFTEREFTPTTGVTRTFEADNLAYLSLAPYDLRSVTSVQVDTDETAVTLSASEYRLAPRPNPDGVYTAIRMAPLTAPTGDWVNRQVQITGDWGFASVPEDVCHATVVTVAEWMRRDVQSFTTVYNLEAGFMERPEALPKAVVGVLSRWKRMAL